MPEPGGAYVLAAVLVSAAVTWTLRAAPFALLAPLRRSALMARLKASVPVGVMTILVVYTMFSVAGPDPGVGTLVAMGVATLVTVGLHLWRRNWILSILAGTTVHVVLVSTVLAG